MVTRSPRSTYWLGDEGRQKPLLQSCEHMKRFLNTSVVHPIENVERFIPSAGATRLRAYVSPCRGCISTLPEEYSCRWKYVRILRNSSAVKASGLLHFDWGGADFGNMFSTGPNSCSCLSTMYHRERDIPRFILSY